MTKEPPTEVDAIFEKLRQGFVETAFQKLEDLNDMLNGLWEERSAESEILNRFLGEIHSLKGGGGDVQISHDQSNYPSS